MLSRYAGSWRTVVYPTAFVAFLLIAWQIIAMTGGIETYVLPQPLDILEVLRNDYSMLLSHARVTLYETLLGFGLSVAVGIPLAIFMVSFRPVEQVVYPVLIASQVVPKVAIAPIFVIWLGFGLLPKVLIAFLIAFFPIVISTSVGFRQVDPETIDLTRSMGASRYQRFQKVMLPHATPHIFGGCKVAIALAVVGAIVGEFIASDEGLGYVLLIASGNLDTAMVFAILFVLTAMGILLFGALSLAERLTQKGRRDAGVAATI